MRRRSARGNGCGECGHRSHRETMVITRTREPVDVFLKSSVPCCYQAGDHASHQTLEVCTALCRTCML
ncbi:YlmG homolog protein 2 chloroplastic [Zea mays]|nr:YlmG homolog protein 2 chloroplastic [Zea mays]